MRVHALHKLARQNDGWSKSVTGLSACVSRAMTDCNVKDTGVVLFLTDAWYCLALNAIAIQNDDCQVLSSKPLQLKALRPIVLDRQKSANVKDRKITGTK